MPVTTLTWSDFGAAVTITGVLHAVILDEPDQPMCGAAVVIDELDQPWNPLRPDACWACARAVNELVEAAQPPVRRNGHSTDRTGARHDPG